MLELCFIQSFGGSSYDYFINYGHTAQDIALSVCVILALHNSPNRYKCCIFVVIMHSVISGLIYSFTDNMDDPFIMAFSLFFFTMWYWVARRSPLPKQQEFNNNNILLAFYTGNNGSFIMNLFQVMSEPVSSVCVLAGKHSLMLRKGKGFQFNETHGFFRDQQDYFIIDTGVRHGDHFIDNMRECANIRARKLGLRINCIFAIEDLLADIGEEWRPIGLFENIPSVYFRKAYGLS